MANSLLADNQHGFVPGRSCVTQLLEVLDKWTEILDNEWQKNLTVLSKKAPNFFYTAQTYLIFR